MYLFLPCTHDSACMFVQASFLTPAEGEWLHRRQAAAAAATSSAGTGELSARSVLKDPRLWHLAAISLVSNIPKCAQVLIKSSGQLFSWTLTLASLTS